MPVNPISIFNNSPEGAPILAHKPQEEAPIIVQDSSSDEVSSPTDDALSKILTQIATEQNSTSTSLEQEDLSSKRKGSTLDRVITALFSFIQTINEATQVLERRKQGEIENIKKKSAEFQNVLLWQGGTSATLGVVSGGTAIAGLVGGSQALSTVGETIGKISHAADPFFNSFKDDKETNRNLSQTNLSSVQRTQGNLEDQKSSLTQAITSITASYARGQG